MFYNCTSLSNVLALPAKTAASSCYYRMFYNCKSLTTAPTLPITTLTSNCYYNMFYGCSNLKYINTNQTSFTGCTSWVQNVATSGTFNCLSALGTSSSITRGVSACPTNWTVTNSFWGLHFFAIEKLTISAQKNSHYTSGTFQYSTNNGSTWPNFTPGTTTVTVNAGKNVWFRAKTTTGNDVAGITFVVSGKFKAEGEVYSLLSQTKPQTYSSMNSHNFAELFSGCTSLVDASNLIIPDDGIGFYTFNNMFYNCTNLIYAPELPATSLGEGCYYSMFQNCASLIKAPSILPATFFNTESYSNMFDGCTSLVVSPVIMATGGGNYGMYEMFSGCSSLRSISVKITSFSNITTNWVSGVSSIGTFTCPSALGTDSTIARGTSACPVGWTVVNA